MKHLEKELEKKDASIGVLQNEVVAYKEKPVEFFEEPVTVKDENSTI